MRRYHVAGQGWHPQDGMKVIDTFAVAETAEGAVEGVSREYHGLGWISISLRADPGPVVLPKNHVSRGVI